MHGTAFRAKGMTNFSLKIFGKMSVGDSDTNIKAIINRILLKVLFSDIKNQMAIPASAIMKVDDSAL